MESLDLNYNLVDLKMKSKHLSKSTLCIHLLFLLLLFLLLFVVVVVIVVVAAATVVVVVVVCARLEQLVRSLTTNQEVPGSIPGMVEG